MLTTSILTNFGLGTINAKLTNTMKEQTTIINTQTEQLKRAAKIMNFSREASNRLIAESQKSIKIMNDQRELLNHCSSWRR